MIQRSRKPPKDGDGGLPRATTEVRVVHDDHASVERAQTTEPALVLVEGELAGQVFRLRVGRQIIGRRPECDIRVREKAVSGIHAEVMRERDTVRVRDLASTNGTLVNGAKIRAPVTLAPGNLVTMGTCVFRYVDSLLEVEFTESLHKRGITDQLTGAFNGAWLVFRLGFAIDMASPLRPVSVIAFDFDEFKQVNDRYGHPAGDHILRATSSLVASTFGGPDHLFARVGGEEFVLLLPDTPLETAMRTGEEIRRTFAGAVFDWEGAPISLTASFGVATTVNPVESPQSLLSRADELLYASKREGRNRVSG